MRNIDFAEFSRSDENPLNWYDFLVDHLHVSDIPHQPSPGEMAEAVMAALPDPSFRDLDMLAALLINGECRDVGARRWFDLFEAVSRLMASHLTPSGHRPLRMRCQRLAYCIQLRCSADEGFSPAPVPAHVEREFILDGHKAWDYLHGEGGAWWISSEQLNVHNLPVQGSRRDWRLGLPTQIDELGNGELFVGSFYTPGGFMHAVGKPEWRAVSHERPIVTAWRVGANLAFLDMDGLLHQGEVGKPSVPIGRPHVHFARVFDDVLYAIDNSDVARITQLDLKTLESRRLDISPVLVCNDIALCGDAFYLIDKQQGHVFKFDRDFRYVSKALFFGAGPGQLLDPVSIRAQGGLLNIVSWINSKVTVLRPF